jgi:hypothetical protein
MYIVENVKKRFVRVLRSVTSTNKTDRQEITEQIVKRDVKHHNPLTLTIKLSPMYCSDSITFKLQIDWFVFNANFSSISAISWREQILYYINLDTYKIIRNKTYICNVKHHNPLTLTIKLSPMYCSDSITFKLIIVRLKCWNVAFETTKFT